MINSRTLIPIGCLLMTGALAPGQTPAAAAPSPRALSTPTPQAAPAPMPMRASSFTLDSDQMDQIREMADQAREQAREARDNAQEMRESFAYQYAQGVGGGVSGGVAGGVGGGVGFGAGGGAGWNGFLAKDFTFNTPMAFAQNISIAGRRNMSDDRLYEAGLRALDNYKWDEALEDFNQVASRAGNRADGAWYWKAYTLNKMGRRDDAKAALAELRKSFATSRWLDEAKALELEVQQASGKPVSPESQSDEELKLMALNGIMQSDPDRAIPLIENILKGPGSPKMKARALFVLAQSSTPRAQQIIEQIARGGSNPDLQVRAIEYLSQRRRSGAANQNALLQEIWASTTDLSVKRAILNAFQSTRDKDRLAMVARSEKNSDLRVEAFRALASNNPGQPELWTVYQAETSPDMKIELLRCMHQDGNAEKIAEVVKTEKDPKVRRAAIEVLSDQRAGNAADLLVSAYGSETDPKIKESIVNSLANQRTAKYLVQIARAEKDTALKLRIVERLSNIRGSKEAQDYLLEILAR